MLVSAARDLNNLQDSILSREKLLPTCRHLNTLKPQQINNSHMLLYRRYKENATAFAREKKY